MKALGVLFCLLIVFSSCKNKQDDVIDSSLIGKWRLFETYRPGTNGTIIRESVPAIPPQLITITKNELAAGELKDVALSNQVFTYAEYTTDWLGPRMVLQNKQNKSLAYNYGYDVVKDTLRLLPIESNLNYRYVKVGN